MPRTWRSAVAPALVAVLCAALPPALLHGALAAAAGTLFEAAPFVLAAELLPSCGPLATVVESLGCGCGRRLPGALSLPATALAWLSFGPAVAVARFAGALVVARRPDGGGAGPRRSAKSDALAELAALAPWALLAGVVAQTVAALPPDAPALLWFAMLPAAVRAGVALALGGACGVLTPCATAAVAFAAALAGHVPAAAAGLLLTGGLVPRPPFPHLESRREALARLPAPPHCQREERSSSWPCLAHVSLALALALVAAGASPGFVTPRLRPFAGAGALLALAAANRRAERGRRTFVVPAALLAALVAGSPPPPYRADPTRLADAFPGEGVRFLGVAASARGTTSLERYTITCCRIDAGLVAVRLDRRLPRVRDGTWIEANGTLVRAPAGDLVLRPAAWRAVQAPADPYAYR